MNDIWKDKQFWTLVVTAAVMLLVAYVPQLADAQEEIISAMVAVAVVAIAGNSFEKIVEEIANHRVAIARIASVGIRTIEEKTGADFPDSIQDLIENAAAKG